MVDIIDLSLEKIKGDLSLNIVHSNICRIVECDNGYIHPSGFVYSEDGQAFTLDKWYNKKYPAPFDLDTFKDSVCLSLIQIYNNSFQHIPFDTFPKIIAIQKLLLKYPQIKIIVNNELIKKMMMSFFSLDETLFYVVSRVSIYKCKKAIYVNHIHDDGEKTMMGSWGKNILRPWVLQRNRDTSKLIYLSRAGLPKRILPLEQENRLVKVLDKIAIENDLELSVINNPKSPEEVKNQIGKAGLIIGIHGGAFSNMIYSNPSTKILEIIPKIKLEERPCFFYLASSLGLKYSFYEPDLFDFNGDVSVDVEKLSIKISEYLKS